MFAPDTRVLIVDDMKMIRRIVTKTLHEMKFSDVVEAEDGQKAWETILSSTPPIELVISDWNMPVCTGIELLKKVRLDRRFQHLPFILLTAEIEQSQIQEAIINKVSNYILKPFTAEILQKKLEETYKRCILKPKAG